MGETTAKEISEPQQAVISAFFLPKPTPTKDISKQRKRLSSPIDLTLDGPDDAPPKKKKKIRGIPDFSVSPIRAIVPGPSRSQHTGGFADQWRFESASPEKQLAPDFKSRTSTEEAARKKNHEAFKKKLLGENSMFLRRKSRESSEYITATDTEEQSKLKDAGESGGESDAAFTALHEQFSNKSKSRNKGKAVANQKKKKAEEVGPSGETWTPLENQILKLKKDNPGVLLMVEVGYKLKFFDEDAEIASTELGIACFQHRNFMEAMIPVHRRDVHLKKLLSKGHKVGIVQQTETAALKAVSDNRNQPFERKLTHLYTAATFVDELDSVDDIDKYDPPPLMCIIEEWKGGMGVDERVSISMISICPSTGDIVYDDFDDTHMRLELETRIMHIKPAELFLPATGLSKPTEKMLTYFAEHSIGSAKIRVERFMNLMSYTDAFCFVSDFYTDKTKSSSASESFVSGTTQNGKLMAAVTDFPKQVVVALAMTIKHLSAFGVADAFLETKFFSKFTIRTHMLLNGNTLTNLEIYRNETDFTAKGSLMWILDRTTTKFGARLLKSWVGRPLVDKTALQERVEAVEEITTSSSEKLVTLRQILKKLPDLAKGLCRIQYGKCTPKELSVLLPAFHKIATSFHPFESPSEVGFTSTILNDIIFSLPKLKSDIQGLVDSVLLKQAAEGKKDTMWADADKYPAIADIDLAIQTIEVELMDELKSIRKIIKKPSLQYTAVVGEEYVVEIKKMENREIPLSWHILSRTKSVTRYHTPEVKKKIQERAQYKEALNKESCKAFALFLDEIAQNHYGIMRAAVNNLAIADCLLSLAHVALQEGYVRPEFTEDDTLEIVQGRHPMVEALRSDPFVPNSIMMGNDEPRSKVITGPNMGGKSSAVRMVALIAIMAQIGSYVPAESVKLGMLDGILTRMGASDELARGRSTFMVEMSETSEILHTATQRSLAVIDELGRGTGTQDGMAVASAVLQHLLQTIKCKTLFITHYPLVAIDLEKRFPNDLQNLHMGYTEDLRVNGTRDITFLYRLARGVAKDSFGVECARLAGVPEHILTIATERSGTMRAIIEKRSKKNKTKKCVQLLTGCLEGKERGGLQELQEVIESMAISHYDQ